MKDLVETVEETVEWMDMVEERIPGIKPMLDAKRQELAEGILAAFQPIFDLADGKITQEEFDAIFAEREARSLAEREATWGEPEDGEWVVECSEEECVRDDLVYEELPPLYPTCEDAEGISCVVEDEDEEDQP